MTMRTGLISILALVLLASCASREVVLPGERLGIRAALGQGGEPANRSVALRLGRQVDHAAWPQRAGGPGHAMRHAAFNRSAALVWTAPVGQGNDRRHRITADPVAAHGRIFTLDSRARVAAVSDTGRPLWSRDLTPAGENPDDGSGGGLALAGDVLFATTGFGDLYALNAADGGVIWRQRLEAEAAGAPTVSGGLVYVSTRDSRGLAIDAKTGRVRWQTAGAPSPSGVVGGAAPAVAGGIAVFPFASGELVGTFARGGFRRWRASVAGARVGKAYSRVSDVTGDPVIRAGVVYAGSPAGRSAAFDLRSGETIWSAREGAMGPAWVEGGAVFQVSDRAQLVRLNARTGARVWAVALPQFVPVRNPARKRDVYAHFGPVLAGGLLWVASSDGHLRGFAPEDGALAADVALPAAAASRPIVVRGTMYVVGADGRLMALR